MQLLREGGSAVGGSRISKDRIQPTLAHYIPEVLDSIPHKKWGTIGSTGKKPDNGDIDLGLDTSLSLEEISNILKQLGIQHVVNKGLGEINTAFPQYTSDGEQTTDIVQVDLMVGNYDWISFVYVGYGPNDTKYKPLTRTAALYGMLRFGTEELQEDGSVLFYSISPNRGVFQKLGKMVTNRKGIEEFKSDKVGDYIQDPQAVASLISTHSSEPWAVGELMLPFERIWALIEKRFAPELRIKIAGYIRDFCTNQKLEIPSELSSAFIESVYSSLAWEKLPLPGEIIDISSVEMAPIEKPNVDILAGDLRDEDPTVEDLRYDSEGTRYARKVFGESTIDDDLENMANAELRAEFRRRLNAQQQSDVSMNQTEIENAFKAQQAMKDVQDQFYKNGELVYTKTGGWRAEVLGFEKGTYTLKFLSGPYAGATGKMVADSITYAIKEAAKTAHLTHLEDLFYDEGEEGGYKVFSYLEGLLASLKGNTPSKQLKTTVKVDGSPAICIAGSYPGVDAPFVGTKNTFAKTPQIYTTPEAIDAKYGAIPDLANKLKTALRYAPLLSIPDGEIWKGDFLFTSENLFVSEEDGKQWLAFTPNTITYAVEAGSELGQRIRGCELGIVFHTRYRGTDLSNAEATASFDIDVAELTIPETAFIIDANIPSIAGNVTLTEKETTEADTLLAEAEESFDAIKGFINELAGNATYTSLLNMYENNVVRTSRGGSTQFDNPDKYVDGMVDWIISQYAKESATKKTAKGQQQTIERGESIRQFFLDNKDAFVVLFDMQGKVVQLKNLFISKLNNLSRLVPFVKNPDGSLQITGNEGFAVSDIDGDIVKFVDRLTFSRMNFNKVREATTSLLRESPESDAREVLIATTINKRYKKKGLTAERPVASTKYPDVLLNYGGEEIWVEVKMNHTDQLGSPRFFYQDGQWRSTTPGLAQDLCKILDEDEQTQEFIALVKKVTKKKNPYLKDTLGSDDPNFVTLEDMQNIKQIWGNGYIYKNDNIEMGKLVRKHYSAKAAPASYIQAGDDFYLLTKDRLNLVEPNQRVHGYKMPILGGKGNLRVRFSLRSKKYEILAEIKITLVPESPFSVLPGSDKIDPFEVL